MGVTNYTELALLNHLFLNTQMVSPSGHYIGLLTSYDENLNIYTEVSGLNYQRQEVSFYSAIECSGTPASGYSCSVSGTTVFPESHEDWGSVSGIALYDASVSGNTVLYANITNGPFSTPSGTIISFGDNSIEFRIF